MKFSSPDYQEAARKFADFVQTINRLRHPETGCPWDIKQTMLTLRKYMLEEAYEACEAMTRGNRQDVIEELGDVLLQVVLNAQVGSETQSFDINDVIDSINSKIIERHPHVFAGRTDIDTEEKVKENWKKIKDQTKGVPNDLYAEAKNMGKNYPASLQTIKIGQIAKDVQFDWKNVHEVFEQFKSEVVELSAELKAKEIDRKKTAEEMGDVFFSLIQVCRHLGLDPEVTMFAANLKFFDRWTKMQKIADKRGVNLEKLPLAEKEKLWQEIK